MIGACTAPVLTETACSVSPKFSSDVEAVLVFSHSVRGAELNVEAMFLILSIKGFRSAAVRALTLEDIDWRRESIIVHRAK
jgi:integrase